MTDDPDHPPLTMTAEDWAGCSRVEMVPGKLSGAPVVTNTRLPVDAILSNFDDGLNPAQIADVFEVALADVEAALQYRAKHLGDGRVE